MNCFPEAELKREFFRSNILGLEDQLSLLKKRKDTLEIEFKNLKDSASKKDQISAKSITMKQKEIDSIYFELKNIKFSDKYHDSHLSLALQTSIQLKCQKVYLVVFDGYSRSYFFLKNK